MSDTLEALVRRIEELETQMAFQDELHESLNTTVAKQDAEILDLKRQFSLLSDRLKDIGDASGGAQPQDETPPHY
ncbi:MAG: SlyX family protein [Calditrichaeota bacterium]|nr:SlyX family protein [Calditrichota bacterium]